MIKDERGYRVKAPIGNVLIPKEVMTEKELREFVSQIIQDTDQRAIWIEKIEKDPIESVVDWLLNAGYTVLKQ